MACNVVVKSKECRGNHEKMIRKFIKKCKKDRVIEIFKEKQYYKKPSEKRREKQFQRLATIEKIKKKESQQRDD